MKLACRHLEEVLGLLKARNKQIGQTVATESSAQAMARQVELLRAGTVEHIQDCFAG